MPRLQKLIADAGLCSRRHAEELIKQGKVTLDGKRASIGDTAEAGDGIEVEGRPLPAPRRRYLMLHKPVGCVSAVRDRHEPTVMRYVRVKERVYPVGRLDKDTSGLLLLTNDGEFANAITHPSKGISKTYLVELERDVPGRTIPIIAEGIMVDKRPVQARVRKLAPQLLELTIVEGRNRIVRRMMEEVGLRVRRLQRIRIGALELDVKSGRWRELSAEERAAIFP